MTDAHGSAPPPGRPAQRRPAPARKPSHAPVFLVTGALFFGLFGLLGVRMAHGQDPALGPKKQAAVVQPRKVLVRKVVVTKRITVIKPPKVAAHPSSSGQSSAPTPASSAPVQTYTPPPAPTYTPAPAPAPAPAPVVTATS